MIGHIEHGSDFGGLFRYLLATDKGARIIGGSAAGNTPYLLTQEFNNCADLRRTTTKPVKHFIASFAPSDGYVDDEIKTRVAKQIVARLGYTNNQYLVVDHHRDDPGHDWHHDHDHIHIVANTISLDGKRVDDWQDKRRLEKILRELEKEENLTKIAPSSQRRSKALSHGQVQRLKREISEYRLGNKTSLPEIPQMVKLQAAISRACEDRPEFKIFIGRLQHLGIDVRPSISDRGRKRISYGLGELKVRGSKLHNSSFPKLIKERGIDFDLSRDRAVMDAVAKGEKIDVHQDKLVEWGEIDLISYLPEAIQKELKMIGSSLIKETDEREKLASLVLSSNPAKVNTSLKNEGIRIDVKSNSSIEISETSGERFTLLTGLYDDEGWDIQSKMNDEYTSLLLDLVAEAIEKTRHLEMPKPERSQFKFKSGDKKSQDFEIE